MTATSIRNMNYTLARREQEGSMNTLPIGEPLHYWFVERKSKVRRDGKYEWIFVRDLFATKSQAAQIWNKHFRFNTLDKFRLVHKLSYRR